MKKLTLITAIIFTVSVLWSQTIQIDIPGEELPQKIIKDDSKSTFTKQPYLIFEGINTQMRVIWQLEETATCEIFWGSDSTYSLGNVTTTEYGNHHQHGHTITGLNPGTKYHYKVEYDDAICEASFKTAPEETATDLKFFVYGDTRSDNAWHDMNSEKMIADYTADPDFQTLTLFTGDHVTFGADEDSWQTSFFSPDDLNIRKRMAEVPFVSCLGNHELYYDDYDSLDYNTVLFGNYFPYPFVERRYWSFDYGPIHVVVLDQYPDYYEMLPPNGFLDTEQMDWVEQDLMSTDKPWKIIIMHEPGWSCEGSSSGYSHPNNEDVQNLLQPLCEQYGVQIVFSAHNHYYARACKNGVYHITTAGGGAPLYEVEEDFPNVINTKKVRHYCRVEIEDETMSVTAISTYGEVIDEFVVDQEDQPNHLLGFLSKEAGSGLIDDVTISASGQTTTADETGYYGLELVPGYHEASFLLSGYVPLTETTEIFEGTETQLDTMLMLGQGCLPEGITFTTQEEIDNFQSNYPNCTEIEGDVIFSGSNITNLNGLSVLTSIGGNLEIEYCMSLNSLQGLHNVQFVGGNFSLIWNAFSNLDGLQSLTTIIGDFMVGEGEILNNLIGLENLVTIGGSVSFGYPTMGGPACTHLVSLNGLENLNFIGGDLNFYSTILLEELSGLSGLTNIGGDLWIYANDVLQSLAGLENIESGSISNLNINTNPLLSTCEVQSICDYLTAPNGTIEIHNNAPGCNNLEEVQDACFNSVDEFSNLIGLSISPNPANELAILRLNIQSKSSVEICIYNTTGICLKNWQFQNQQPGEKEFKLDLKELPAGIYFCHVQIGNEMVTKKIIKVK